MKLSTLMLLILPLFAADKAEVTAATIASLRAENELLRAQLMEAQVGAKWDLVVCRQADLMRARLVTVEAVDKVQAAKAAEKKAEEVKK